MSVLPQYKVFKDNMIHTVAEICRVQGGIRWYGPGVGRGWLLLNPDFDWYKQDKPSVDELLEVVTEFDY